MSANINPRYVKAGSYAGDTNDSFYYRWTQALMADQTAACMGKGRDYKSVLTVAGAGRQFCAKGFTTIVHCPAPLKRGY